jgi:hypothetical protein
MNIANGNSIQTIKTYVEDRKGLQRSNRFDVQIYNIPANIGRVNFMAQQVDLGPRTIETVADNLQGYGLGRTVPRSQTLIKQFGVQLTFPVTNDNQILKVFNSWFNYFYANTNAGGFGYFSQYYDKAVYNTQMVVRTLDPNGGVNNTMTFYEVFPVESQPMTMSMLKPDMYMSYTVVLAYRYYRQDFYK